MSGTSSDDIYMCQVSIDFGTGNPFAFMTNVITRMSYPRFEGGSTVPAQVEPGAVEEESIIENRSNPPEDESFQPDSFFIESSSEPVDNS